MREISFRGKTEDGKWVEGNYVKAYDYGHVESIKHLIFSNSSFYGYDGYTNDEEVIIETVGQFTGLTDKNGKKIFEGDIVTGRFLHSLPINAVVAFRNGSFGLLWDRAGVETFDAFTSLCNIVYEVIGNINDNPELLEVAK